MNWAKTIFLLIAAFLAVFLESAIQVPRRLLGAQIDLLPALMVCASLSQGLIAISLVAFCGGLLFDSLSANPLGVSVLPLFVIGLAIYSQRDLILRDQLFAQVVIGFGASVAAPILTLIVLFNTGHRPSLGWGTLWQILVMGGGGAVATPACSRFLSWLDYTFLHRHAVETSFRTDREIRRGRI